LESGAVDVSQEEKRKIHVAWIKKKSFSEGKMTILLGSLSPLSAQLLEKSFSIIWRRPVY